MKNSSNIYSNSLSILTLKEVAPRIKKSDKDAVRKWLSDRGVKIYKDSKPHYVFEIDVDCQIDLPFVRDLRNKFPEKWEEIYRELTTNDAVYEMILFLLKGEARPKTKLKITSKDDMDLFKQLTA